jgi:ribulose-phosphate 3-epimerase
MSDLIVATSILSADFTRLGEQLRAVEDAGGDWLHVDVMDGHFVPNLTMGPFIVEACRRASDLPLDVHLMVEDADQMIDWYADAGANRISVQIEACPNVYRTLEKIRARGCHPGIVLSPGTPASAIGEVLHLVDLVLVMTVSPGYSGQTFLPSTLPKIALVKQMLAAVASPALIQVDGGLTSQTLPLAYQAGACVCVAATSVFRHPAGIAAGIAALRQAVI